MISVWDDYESRVKEVNRYFIFLIQEIDDNSDTELVKILKSNGFLMLYNLLESTVRNAIEEIHSSINLETIRYSELINEIKSIWIEFHYNKFKADKKSKIIVEEINQLASNIFNVPYDDYTKKRGDFSGNLDRRKIDNLAEKYGFKKNSKIEGKELFTIKNARNNLAHGNQSYTEVGKKYDKSDMVKFKRVCVLYLKELLINVEGFIKNKVYKE